ncbi:MAG: hypothetical protein GEU96_00965 [Propionibacteriales bacterium]|nr:hypothetical protein [Propionibacteriales bacterium]
MTAEHQIVPPDEMGPVHTDDDLLERWQLLMGPWGFDLRQLWILWFDQLGHMSPGLLKIEELDLDPDPELLDRLMVICEDQRAQLGGGWVAIALGRPGPGLISGGDRAWAAAVDAASRRAELDVRPLYLATTGRVRPLVLDEL